MRQVFLSHPWIHRPAPPELIQFFNERGRWIRLPAGGAIFNGGDVGEVGLVLSGLGAFSFQDASGSNHIFSILPPGRLMGDVDGLSGEMVNVIDTALRETEMRLMPRQVFLSHLQEHPEIQHAHVLGVISDHESDMEGMTANFTLPVEERITALFESMLHHYPSEPEGGFRALPWKLKTVEISQIVSAARPTVSTMLTAWRERGLLRRDGGRLLVAEELLDGYDWAGPGRGATPAVRIRRHPKNSEGSREGSVSHTRAIEPARQKMSAG